MAEFGWTVPVLVATDGELIAGHGRVLAAAHLGLTEAPVTVLGHLSEAQRRAYRIADNKLTELGGWNEAIRRFEEDYRAKPKFLTENYRSTRYIIDASNQVIEPARDRMKAGHAITVDNLRGLDPGGGAMATFDPVGRGRVQFLDVAGDDVAQAVAAVDELVRISRLDPDFSWARTAIVSRDWRRLGPVRAYAEKLALPVEMANEKLPNVWRLREMQRLVAGLRQRPAAMLTIQDILDVLNQQRLTRWVELIAEGIADLARELGPKRIPVPDALEWLAEWAQDIRGAQRGLLLLTAHRSKGLEFDHVVILTAAGR